MKSRTGCGFFCTLSLSPILGPIPAIRFKSSGRCAALRAFHCYPGYGVPARLSQPLNDHFLKTKTNVQVALYLFNAWIFSLTIQVFQSKLGNIISVPLIHDAIKNLK